jgi:phage-related protein
MTTFPLLKTKAVAQYPATKTVQFHNQALRFIDGTEQRYRDAANPLHCWVIQLNALDETEMAAVDNFFAQNQGRLGAFSFTDPWDGTVYAGCSVQSDQMTIETTAELRGRASVTIAENRT